MKSNQGPIAEYEMVVLFDMKTKISYIIYKLQITVSAINSLIPLT